MYTGPGQLRVKPKEIPVVPLSCLVYNCPSLMWVYCQSSLNLLLVQLGRAEKQLSRRVSLKYSAKVKQSNGEELVPFQLFRTGKTKVYPALHSPISQLQGRNDQRPKCIAGLNRENSPIPLFLILSRIRYIRHIGLESHALLVSRHHSRKLLGQPGAWGSARC